jgi:hypothetical protein
VSRVLAVTKVETNDIHSSHNHLLQDFIGARCRAKSTHDLCMTRIGDEILCLFHGALRFVYLERRKILFYEVPIKIERVKGDPDGFAFQFLKKIHTGRLV